MEASFFSEEKCSVFSSAADLDVGESLIFDRLVSNSGKQFDPITSFWEQIDDDAGIFGGVSGNGENNARVNKKEDFHKMLNEWQEHLSSMQFLDSDKIRPEIPDMFAVLPTSQPIVSIDELFPVECATSVKEEVTLEGECMKQIDEKCTLKNNECKDVKEEMQTDSDPEEYSSCNTSVEELVKVEAKNEPDDECVDVETVGEKMPVLEAGDMATLLEQFEASEAVNTSCQEADPETDLSHKNIRDALPKEVIDRIKASTRKKSVPLVPPVPTKKTGLTATRMQDAAATLCRNKLLKLVSSNGESVQLDHDYCSGKGSEGLVPPPRNFYQTDISDYNSSVYSRLPDYFVALAPQKALEPSKGSKDWGEKNSKKDSGLESGDVSDASEEVPPPKKTMSMVSVLKRNNFPQNNSSVSAATTKTSVTPCVDITTSSSICSSVPCSEKSASAVTNDEPVRKRKLNLEEYRSRREERERIRCEESSRTCSPDLSFESLSSNASSLGSVSKEEQQIQELQQKVVMHSVEVQATPDDIEKSDISKSKVKPIKNSQEPSRRRREYRTRRVSSSSSSSSPASRRSKHRSSQRIRRNSNSSSRNGGASSRSRSIWSRSRSPSSSSISSCSTCRSKSRSRSRTPPRSDSRRNGGGRWRSRSLWRTKHRFNKSAFNRRDSWHHQRTSSWVSGSASRTGGSRDSISQNPPIEWSEKEKIRQVEERRVIYVGRIEEGTTKAHLRERFSVFGPIIDISVHFREHGDNYGFVTFAYKVDAYEAVEHGNDDPLLPRYDLSFGGRRAFCKQRYADLDGERNNLAYRSLAPPPRSDASFDSLLREARAKLNKRSSV